MANMPAHFVYTSPFVLRTNQPDPSWYTQTLWIDEAELAQVQKFDDALVQFMLHHKLLLASETRITMSPESDMGSLVYWLNWGNARALVDKSELMHVINALLRDKGVMMNHLILLHAHLGMMIDRSVLNSLTQATLQAIQIIPYDLTGVEVETTWDVIHIENPFLWLLIYMQMLIKRVADPLQ